MLPLRDTDRAIALTERAKSLDPFNGFVYVVRAYAESLRGNYDAANEQYEILMRFDADFPHIHVPMSGILHNQGKHPEALDAARRGAYSRDRAGEANSDAIASLAYSLAMVGEMDAMRRSVDELTTRSKNTYVSPWCFALVYSGRRDRTRCLAKIGEMLKERSGRSIMLLFDHRFDWIRPDPDFQAILQRAGLSSHKPG